MTTRRPAPLLVAALLVAGSLLAGPPIVAGEPPSAGEVLQAALAVFTDGYRELAKVTYETSGDGFYLHSVTFLVPEKAWRGAGSEDDLRRKACEVKQRLNLECACESVQTEPARDYAWSTWPDKRVVPVTIRFALGC